MSQHYASPIIANLPRGWINLEGSIPNRHPIQSFGMYEVYDHTQCPTFPNDTDFNISLNKCGALDGSNSSMASLNASVPDDLKQLFKDKTFFGSGNGVCHYWLRDCIGPLDVYLPTNQFCLYPFYHDQQSIMTWFALCDLNVTDPTLIGSANNPCIVSGVSDANIEADEYYYPNVLRLTREFILVADSVQEFVWREGIEAEITNPSGPLSAEATLYQNQYP